MLSSDIYKLDLQKQMNSCSKSKVDSIGVLPYSYCVKGCIMSLYCLTNPRPDDAKLIGTGRYPERFFGFVCKHCGRVYFVTDGPLWEELRLRFDNVELVAALSELEWFSIPRHCRRAESNMNIRALASNENLPAGARIGHFYQCPDCHFYNGTIR